MTREKKLGTGIYLSAEELIPAALLVLCAFLKTVAVTVTDTTATSLYLLQGPDNLPFLPVFAAVLLMVVWPVLSAVKEKSPRGPAYFMLAAAGISLPFYVCSFFLEASEPLFIWKFGFCVLAETAFWVTAFRFGVFGKKARLLCPVLFAIVAGWFSGGILIRVFAESPVFMSCASVLSACGAAYVLKKLADNGSIPILNRFTFDKQKIKRQGYDSFQKKLLLCFYTVSGLISFATGIYILLFLLYMSFFGALVDTETTYDFNIVIGSAYVLAAVLSFLFLLNRRLGKHFGLFAGLFLFPLLLLLVFLLPRSPFLLMFFAQILFIVSVFVKEAALQIIPWAVSSRTGYRAVLLRKSVVEPIAFILCGVFFIIEDKTGALDSAVFYISVVLAVITTLAIIALRQTYSALVLNMLNTHMWRGGRLFLTGKQICAWLKENLESEDSQNVLYALRVVEESGDAMFAQYVKQALRHPNEDVRLYALAKIEELKLKSALSEIRILTQQNTAPAIRRNAVRVICRLGTEKDRESVEALIYDSVVREGALTGLLAAGREGVFTAIKSTADLAISDRKEDRLIAANVLGDTGNPAFYQPLEYLLTDSDPEICKAALNAAGKLANPALLPAVMNTFRYPELREAAADALSQFKETAFNEIDAVLRSNDMPVQFRILLTRLTARIASPAAEDFLFDHIRLEDRRVRFNIIKVLALSGYKAAGKKINVVRLCLYDEMETATGILAATYALDKNKNEELSASFDVLKTALSEEIEYIKERILLLLNLIYPSKALTDFLNTYTPATPQDEKAVKITDKLLSDELRMLCMPLFENKTLQQRLALLRPQFYPPVLPAVGHIRNILKSPAGILSDWTRACAIYAAGFINDKSFTDDLTVLLNDADAIIRETTVWALGKILPREEAARLIGSRLNDSADYVARMARFVSDGMGQTSF